MTTRNGGTEGLSSEAFCIVHIVVGRSVGVVSVGVVGVVGVGVLAVGIELVSAVRSGVLQILRIGA